MSVAKWPHDYGIRDLRQDQGFSPFGRESIERHFARDEAARVASQVRKPGVDARRSHRPAACRAQGIDRGVMSDRRHPAPDARVRPVTGQGSPHPDEHLLGNVVRVLPSGDVGADSPYLGPAARDQDLESCVVAKLHPRRPGREIIEDRGTVEAHEVVYEASVATVFSST